MSVLVQLRLSKSKVLTYLQCPLSYKKKIIDGIKQETTPQMQLGTDIHKAFENFYKEPSITNFFGNVYSQPPEVSPKIVILDAFKRFNTATDFQPHISNFAEFCCYVYSKNPKYFFPVALEEKIYDEQKDIVGVIDRVDHDGQNTLVLDYKTGKYDANKVFEYRFELAIYAHLWNLKNPDKKATHWGIFFSKFHTRPWKERVIDAEIEKALQKCEMVKNKIINNKFPPTPSFESCRYCGVECEYRSDGY